MNLHVHKNVIRKASAATELRRITTLANKLESGLMRRFGILVGQIQNPAVLTQIRQFLEAGNVRAANSMIRSYAVDFTDALTRGFEEAGVAEVGEIVGSLGGRTVGISFNAGNKDAAKLIQQSNLQFIKDFTRLQRAATRQALNRSLRAGDGPRATARALRDSIGLTPTQEDYVSNYRAQLEDNDRGALDRALRDRRMDTTIERAIEDEEPLGDKTIDRMVDQYRLRMLNYRAEVIARTESGRALAMSRHEAMNQVADQVGFDPDEIIKTWNSMGDARVRDTHEELDGTSVTGMDTPFVSSSGAELLYPRDPEGPAEEVIQCRCVLTYEMPDGSEVDPDVEDTEED